MSCNYRNKEKVKTSEMKFFLFIQGSVFLHAKSKYIYFCQPEPETLDNPEKTDFFGLSRVSELN